ncbi:MAG TPA: phage baseplate protein [Blastocatellia bacterium]|nr:phage baseplate protein [Blastocatellia bacterium]
MRPLNAIDVVRIWESGLNLRPPDRGLAILSSAIPQTPLDELASLSLGRRDSCLLSIRERLFGSDIDCFAECPACDERLEFTVNAVEIRVNNASEAPAGEFELSTAGYDLRVRLINSGDLDAISACKEREAARQMLVQRCVIEASRDGAEVSAAQLPDEAVVALANRLAERDPMAELIFDLTCPACGHRWQVLFDIVAFLWTEISALAKRLLAEVHILARAYGWRESDILSLSARRRRFYLELIGA